MGTHFKSCVIRIQQYSVVQKIIKCCHICHHKYITQHNKLEKILSVLKIIWFEYIFCCARKNFWVLIEINNTLSKNEQSQYLQTKFKQRYRAITGKIIRSVIMTMSNQDVEPKLYKKNLPISNRNMNLDLNVPVNDVNKANNVNNLDVLDDLDDDSDLAQIAETNDNKLKEQTKMNSLNTLRTSNASGPTNVANQNRQLLRNKIAGLRSQRTSGVRTKKAIRNQMANLHEMPNLDEMMQNVFRGDNLEKIMGKLPPGFDPEKIKKTINEIKKSR